MAILTIENTYRNPAVVLKSHNGSRLGHVSNELWTMEIIDKLRYRKGSGHRNNDVTSEQFLELVRVFIDAIKICMCSFLFDMAP